MLKTFLLVSICCFNIIVYAQDTSEHIVQGRLNSKNQVSKPYVILISADGFRYDYADKYHASNLIRLRKSGVEAESMQPCYPSVTFNNHYSIVTGMYPSHHGIVYNRFYDRNRKQSYAIDDRKTVEDGSWYGGIPLWVLAEQQHLITAAWCYVGTEAPIQNTYSTYWYKYSSKTPIQQGIDAVNSWLHLPDSVRPHLITFYIGDVDYAGHTYGPDSKETKAAVLYVDSIINVLNKIIVATKLPVNFIFVSDHGMANVDTVTRINVRSMIDTSKFIIKDGSTSLHLYAKNPADIIPTYKRLKGLADGFSVYLRDSIPAQWHYSTADDKFNRIGDIYILPNYPKVLTSWTGKINPGTHGFDPTMQQMHATFYAWGPSFKQGKKVATFENIHIYPMVCKILGLNYSHQIDGKAEVLQDILKQ